MKEQCRQNVKIIYFYGGSGGFLGVSPSSGGFWGIPGGYGFYRHPLSATTDFDFFLSEVVEDFFLPLFGAVGAHIHQAGFDCR